MLLKPRPKNLVVAPSYFKLTSQIIITAIHDDVEDAVITSVARREKITLSIRFSLNNPEITSKRTSYAGKVIDLRTTNLTSRTIERDAIEHTVRRNLIRTLNLVGQALEDENIFSADIVAELKLTFSMGKAIGITVSKSKEFVNRHG